MAVTQRVVAPQHEAQILQAARKGDYNQVAQWLRLNTGRDLNKVVDAKGESPLMVAAGRGHKDVVEMLLKTQAKVNHVNHEGKTALINAAAAGHYSVIAALHNAGANIDVATPSGLTALYLALKNGHLGVANALRACGAKVDSAFVSASANGDKRIVKELLNEGVNIDHLNKHRDSALILASSHGHDDVVATLLSKGASVNLANARGETALTQASSNGHERVVKLLLANGAKIDTATKARDTAITLAAKHGLLNVVKLLVHAHAEVDHTLPHGDTALMIAAAGNHTSIVGALISAGAILNTTNHRGDTAIMLASRKGHVAVAELLRDKRANLDLVNRDGNTALTLAATAGHLLIVKILLNGGANVHHSRPDGATALILACWKDHADTAQALIATGAETNHEDTNGNTALIVASSFGCLRTVQQLIEGGIDVDHSNRDRNTALMVATQKKHTSIVLALLEAGADKDATNAKGTTATQFALEGPQELFELLSKHSLSSTALFAAIAKNDMAEFTRHFARYKNVRGSSNRTPLHAAASRGRVEMVRQLVESGATVDAVDDRKWTALHHAAKQGNAEIVTILLEQGCEIDVADDEDHTPVAIAAFHGHTAVIQILHKRGASLKRIDRRKRSLLHLAARHPAGEEVVQYLLAVIDNVTDAVRAVDDKGWSPLHHAVSAKNLASVELLLVHRADANARTKRKKTPLIIAAARQDARVLKTLLLHKPKIDCQSDTGHTAWSLAAQSPECKAALLVSYNRHQYYKACNAMLHSTEKKPTAKELKKVVPLITSVDDLEMFMVLLSRSQPESTRIHRESLLLAALNHVIKQELVYENRDFLVFNSVLETCRGQEWLPLDQYDLLILEARKANNANSSWARSIDAIVASNTARLDAHEQSIVQMADDMTKLETRVLLNREVINSVRGAVQQLNNRLVATETNVQTVAKHLRDFHRSYVERLHHEERVKKIKRVVGIFASLVGLVAAPVLHVAFDAAIDLANPIDVFVLVYTEADIVEFLVDMTNEYVLKDGVKHLLEQKMVPEDAFKALLWEEIVLKLPDILDKADKDGHVRNCNDLFRSARSHRALARVNDTVKRQAILPAQPERRVPSTHVLSIPVAVAAATPPEEAPTIVDAKVEIPADETTLTPPEEELAGNETKVEIPADTLNQRHQPTATQSQANPERAKGLVVEGSHKRERVVEGQAASNEKPASTETVSRLFFAEDREGFPYHVAVMKSQGHLARFCELLGVDTCGHDDPLTAMAMQIVTTTTTQELLSPAEYAYCLGYSDVGDYFASRLQSTTTKKSLAKTAKLLEKEKAFPYISVVLRTHGDVELCEQACDLVHAHHPMEACIRAKVVRETKKHVVWTAIEYASRVGYFHIVKHLLNEKCHTMSPEAKFQVLELTWAQHKRQSGRA